MAQTGEEPNFLAQATDGACFSINTKDGRFESFKLALEKQPYSAELIKKGDGYLFKQWKNGNIPVSSQEQDADGKLHGIFEGYHSNGKINQKCMFEHGAQVWMENYDKSGKLVSRKEFPAPEKKSDKNESPAVKASGDGNSEKGNPVEKSIQPDRRKGLSLHMQPKRVADLAPGGKWGFTVRSANGNESMQSADSVKNYFIKLPKEVQTNGIWIVTTHPDAYSDMEKKVLDDVEEMCRKEKIPLFMCRGSELPNGWKRASGKE